MFKCSNAQMFKIEDLIKILLENRGLKTKREREEFLQPKDPHKLTASEVGISPAEIKKAIRRIKQAIKKQEKIIVYGDYDTDGVCAAAILWEVLYGLGAKAMPFIPKREEGYGMKKERLEEFARDGVKLVVTVDQGIVAYETAQYGQRRGLEIIITDHHLPGKKKPNALAVVHTTKLSGAGVAWFLARELGKVGLDFVTIGTIADVMPILGPNRSLVKFGLSQLNQTKRAGLLALFREAGLEGKEIGSWEVGWLIAPRLNASGRLRHALDSLRLLCTTDKERAGVLARNLEETNRERQTMLETSLSQARSKVLEKETSLRRNLIFIAGEYHEGIIGLVAGRLAEEFSRPAVVISQGEFYSKASARSVNGFNIIEAIRECGELLIDAGGHTMAAGFTVKTETLSLVEEKLIKVAQDRINKDNLVKTLKIDSEIPPEIISLKLYQEIRKLAPFGPGNPEPVFLTRALAVRSAQTLGRQEQHLKLLLAPENSPLTLEAIGFGMGTLLSTLSPEKKVDLVYNLILDEWQGEKRVKLKIRDILLV